MPRMIGDHQDASPFSGVRNTPTTAENKCDSITEGGESWNNLESIFVWRIKSYDERSSRGSSGKPRVTRAPIRGQVHARLHPSTLRGDGESGVHGRMAAKKPLLKEWNKTRPSRAKEHKQPAPDGGNWFLVC